MSCLTRVFSLERHFFGSRSSVGIQAFLFLGTCAIYTMSLESTHRMMWKAKRQPARNPIRVKNRVKPTTKPQNPLFIGSGRPVSRILSIPPSISGKVPGPRLPCGAGGRAYQPGHLKETPGTFWLARTGSLPGRSLSEYRRWALTPPFHPSPVPGAPLWERSRPSAGLLSVALDVTGSLRLPAPRVLGPSGLRDPDLRVRASPDFPLRHKNYPQRSGGSDGPQPD